MKRILLILVINLLAVAVEIKAQSQVSNNQLIKVDVTRNYPKKELILQDCMDVEYIPLETNRDFVNQGIVMDIGKKLIVVINFNHDGDIFIYNRTGKALRKINRKGGSGEEYNDIVGITLDEDNKEMFVSDPFTGKILVYDLSGKFKRSFKQRACNDNKFFNHIFNYNKEHLICWDRQSKEAPFILMSKQDGSIFKDIKIPFKKKILLENTLTDKGTQIIKRGQGGFVTTTSTVKVQGVSPNGYFNTMVNFNSNWILVEYSSDTVYAYSPDFNLHPFLVRTPTIQSMDPGVFLMLSLFTDRYFFMQTVKNVYDWNTKKGFPETNLMYDNKEKNFFEYTVYNGDYSTKKEIRMNGFKSGNQENQSWQTFEVYRLIEDYKKGILKGRLKEIASKLEEDDNRVIMLVKPKK